MKQIAFLFVALLAVSLSFAQDGPFGISMGDLPEQHGCESLLNGGNSYLCHDIPKPHPDFQHYIVNAIDETGVVNIIAVGEGNQYDQFGTIVKGVIDKIANQLSNKFGEYELHIDRITNPVSVWTATDEWAKSVYYEERQYFYYWSFEPLEREDGIIEVEVSAIAPTDNTTQLKILFVFSNKEEYDQINNQRGADSF